MNSKMMLKKDLLNAFLTKVKKGISFTEKDGESTLYFSILPVPDSTAKYILLHNTYDEHGKLRVNYSDSKISWELIGIVDFIGKMVLDRHVFIRTFITNTAFASDTDINELAETYDFELMDIDAKLLEEIIKGHIKQKYIDTMNQKYPGWEANPSLEIYEDFTEYQKSEAENAAKSYIAGTFSETDRMVTPYDIPKDAHLNVSFGLQTINEVVDQIWEKYENSIIYNFGFIDILPLLAKKYEDDKMLLLAKKLHDVAGKAVNVTFERNGNQKTAKLKIEGFVRALIYDIKSIEYSFLVRREADDVSSALYPELKRYERNLSYDDIASISYSGKVIYRR